MKIYFFSKKQPSKMNKQPAKVNLNYRHRKITLKICTDLEKNNHILHGIIKCLLLFLTRACISYIIGSGPKNIDFGANRAHLNEELAFKDLKSENFHQTCQNTRYTYRYIFIYIVKNDWNICEMVKFVMLKCDVRYNDFNRMRSLFTQLTQYYFHLCL